MSLRITPDHRALNIQQGQEPQTETEKQYKSVLGGSTAYEHVIYANDIYGDEYKSEVLEAFLLSRAIESDVEKILRVPTAIVQIYKYLFFDLDVFKDELDIESYANTYIESDFGKDLKVCAITLGLDYLRYRFSRGQHIDIDIVTALQNMIETGFILSKATRLNPLDSSAAKEARQWMLSAIRGVESYAKVKPVLEETSDEFKIILETIDHTTNELKNPNLLKDDILH